MVNTSKKPQQTLANVYLIYLAKNILMIFKQLYSLKPNFLMQQLSMLTVGQF